MSKSVFIWIGIALFVCMGEGMAKTITVDDSYIRTDGKIFTIGTAAVEMTLDSRDSVLRLISFKNKLVSSLQEYIAPEGASAPFQIGDCKWTLKSWTAVKANAGGRPAVQLNLALISKSLQAEYHLLAYPRTSIMRQWVDIVNVGTGSAVISKIVPFLINQGIDTSSFNHLWMVGGNSLADEGMLHTAPITGSYNCELNAKMTDEYTPWMAFQRRTSQEDGWFFMQEYMGNWRFTVNRLATGSLHINSLITDVDSKSLAPGEHVLLPTITIGAFKHGLEDMGERVYNWQYEYMWDYTHDDWYGLMSIMVAWWSGGANLQENFAGRLGKLDFGTIDVMRTTGIEVLWDDAGWSASLLPWDPTNSIWAPSEEGPDFAQTQRYLRKSGMRWLLWFSGQPISGVMNAKVGSWGDFQYRTDGMGFDFNTDRSFRDDVSQFLKTYPRSSFHTCMGGSRYAHGFEPQRLADINMFTDPGGGDQTNYYMSYLETPDKWMDVIPPLYSDGKYLPDTTRQLLTMVPTWWDRGNFSNDDIEQLRRMCEIFRYLKSQDVAGRWVNLLHPKIKGDVEFYYSQRTSYDRKKACIILKHRATGKVIVYPTGLIDAHVYDIGFDSTQSSVMHTGEDLMQNGIVIENQKPGEMIYLGLPNRPGSGLDKMPPKAPGRVLVRREINIGNSGAGIYWSPGSDNNWISYYEVRRGVHVLGKVSYGTYYFDHFDGWNPDADYSIRTVDGDGNTSEWSIAQHLADEPLSISALGGHSSESGKNNWTSQTTTDEINYEPMKFIAPVRDSAGASGGNAANQIGGAEGYWEGTDTARTGRGWQQASVSAECVRNWTASRAGRVRIFGRIVKEYYRNTRGGSLNAKILHGNTQIWPSAGWATIEPNDLNGVSHDIYVDVKVGDVLRFILGKGASPDSDVVCWMPRIAYADPEPIDSNASVVRIFCGAKESYTDSAGNIWSADEYFKDGRPMHTASTMENTLPSDKDQKLYQYGRQGKDFTYSIPVAPGLYTVRLKFAESRYEWFFQRPFNLSINGLQMMRDVDICQAARRWKTAHERIFRYVVPNVDGRIVLRFTGGFEPLQKTDQAMIQAIEVLPEIKPTTRINAGSDQQFIDWNSFIWDADSHFEGGTSIHSNKAVSQASPTLYDQELYKTARSGKDIFYSVKVTPGVFTVHLKFAELWLDKPGQRPMDIEINGRLVWKQWDPGASARQVGMAADVRNDDITPDKDGNIAIRIHATGPNDAILQGIEIE